MGGTASRVIHVTETVHRQERFRRAVGSTELFVVRHGESEPVGPDTEFPLVDGHGDPGLAPGGIEDAEKVGERLGRQALDAIYVSKLRRTAQTAAPLAARLGLEPIVDPGLHEVFLGEWEGGEFRRRVADLDPLALRMFAEERWDVIPGGEPADAFTERIGSAFARIVAAHPGGRVAVFVHGGVIAELLHQAVGGGRRWAFIGADNASISHLVATNARWTLRRFNDTSHLHHDFDPPPREPAPTPTVSA